jgi:hypothetical protein
MCQRTTYNSLSCEFVNQTMRFAMIQVTRGWLYKLTQDAARRTPGPHPAHLRSNLLFSQAGKKLSLKILMFLPLVPLCLCFLHLKTGNLLCNGNL